MDSPIRDVADLVLGLAVLLTTLAAVGVVTVQTKGVDQQAALKVAILLSAFAVIALLFIALARRRRLLATRQHTQQILSWREAVNAYSQRELEASEARFRSTFEQAAVGIAHVALDGQFIRVNQHYCELLGYSRAELAQRSFQQVTMAEDLGRDLDHVGRLLRGECLSYTVDKRCIRKDQMTIWVSLTVSLVRDKHRQPLYMIAAANDITARRRAEELLYKLKGELEDRVLERTKRLEDEIAHRKGIELALHEGQRLLQEARLAAEAANKAKSLFLAAMSHEIRTPVSVMLGYAELLLTEGHLEDKAARAVDAIYRNGQNLLALTNDILDLSKVEQGKLEICKELLSPADLLQEVASHLRIKADKKGLALTTYVQGGIPAWIETDAMRLRQILANLIDNAIKFTATGGVRIELSMLEHAGRSVAQWLVSDTGPGIDQARQADLFQAFVQAGRCIARRFGGAGLGLSLARHLARCLGGDVALVRSIPGEGSVFMATVDAGALRRVGPPPAKPLFIDSLEGPSGLRILLAEDTEDSQDLFRALLDGLTAHVEIVADGEAAVARAMREDFDLILMDIQMPVMNGYEATARLRGAGYQKPIIALTAHAMLGEREKCLAAGCTDFLTKPIDRAALLSKIRCLSPSSIPGGAKSRCAPAVV